MSKPAEDDVRKDVKTEVEPQDFSTPWKFSDAVFVVEEERLHVHRAVFAMASPVFEKMFTSEFQEKDNNEIPLPGKSSTEVKELLLLIYPSASEKQITEENCYFLVKLAHEYQMDAIVKKCEDYLVEKLETKSKDGALEDLVFAQTYKLEKLRLASVNEDFNLDLEELKEDELYDQIQSENLKEIMEGMIRRLQGELEKAQRINRQKKSGVQKELEEAQRTIEKFKRQSKSALRDLDEVVRFLIGHVSAKRNHSRLSFNDTESYLIALQMDTTSTEGTRCESLSRAYGYLKALKNSLEKLQEDWTKPTPERSCYKTALNPLLITLEHTLCMARMSYNVL